MTDVIGPGNLKLVSGWSPSRSLDHVIETALTQRVDANDVRRLHELVYLIYTEAEPSVVRDWLVEQLTDGESLFVAEFERWSSHGPTADRTWLLRRGH